MVHSLNQIPSGTGGSNINSIKNTTNSVQSDSQKNSSKEINVFQNEAKKTKKDETTELLINIGVGVGISILVGFAVWKGMTGLNNLLNRKLGQARGLAKHIDFKPAKTVEKAAEFAKKQLGIKKYNIDNLDIANFVNEGLVKASNRCNGKAIMPDIVKWTTEDYTMCTNTLFGRHTLYINKENTSQILSIKKLSSLGKNLDNITVVSLQDGSIKQYVKTPAIDAAKKIASKASENIPLVDTFRNPFLTVYHELGHLLRANLLPESYINSISIPPKKFDLVGKLTKEFLRNPKKQHIAGMVSEYAKSAPEEFCAEVYSLLIENSKKIPQEVLDLYKTYGGTLI